MANVYCTVHCKHFENIRWSYDLEDSCHSLDCSLKLRKNVSVEDEKFPCDRKVFWKIKVIRHLRAVKQHKIRKLISSSSINKFIRK